jgi:hypothetical protein
MPTIRERVSDALLRAGIEGTMERRELERRLAAVRSDTPGHAGACAAALLAGWVDSAMLWLAWRLRPRTSFPAR